MKLRHSAMTDSGRVRAHNEDAYGIGEGEASLALGHLFIVCDGLGGYAAGEEASRLAVEVVLQSYYADPNPDRLAALHRSVREANRQIYGRNNGGMASTIVALALFQGYAFITSVGDSRVYLARDQSLRQITRDHSIVGERVAAGQLSVEEARQSPERHKITRALGNLPDVQIDMFRVALRNKDRLLLSTDGVHSIVNDSEILAFASKCEISELAQRLVQLANQRGGPDNATLLAVQIDQLD